MGPVNFDDVPALKTEKVDVPEWGGYCIIRELSAMDRAELEAEFGGGAQGRGVDMRRAVLSKTVVTEAGDLALTNGQIDRVMASSGGAVERVFEAAMRLSSLLGSDDEAAKN